jgi:hypothetical protein
MNMTKIGSDGREMAPPVPPVLAAFLDTKNGLMWAANDAIDKSVSYAEAEKIRDACRLFGHDDWRFATVDEMNNSVVDRTRYNPAADPELNFKPSYYWTSTPVPSVSYCAFIVNFDYGTVYIHGRNANARVRLVRSVARASQ